MVETMAYILMLIVIIAPFILIIFSALKCGMSTESASELNTGILEKLEEWEVI